jgi:hypothetical protein
VVSVMPTWGFPQVSQTTVMGEGRGLYLVSSFSTPSRKMSNQSLYFKVLILTSADPNL